MKKKDKKKKYGWVERMLYTDEELERMEKAEEEEIKDPKLKKEVTWLRKQEEEAEERIEERLKSKEPKRPIDKEQRERYKEDTKNFLIAVPMLFIGPFILLFAVILFASIPGSDIIALIICLIAIASMIWAWHERHPSP